MPERDEKKNTANQKQKNPHISSTENQREDYQQWRLFGSKVISENSSAKNSGAKTQEQSAGLSQSIQSLQQQQKYHTENTFNKLISSDINKVKWEEAMTKRRQRQREKESNSGERIS